LLPDHQRELEAYFKKSADKKGLVPVDNLFKALGLPPLPKDSSDD